MHYKFHDQPFDTRYSDYLQFASGSVKGKNNSFLHFETVGETYFDSYVANFIDYHIANGFDAMVNAQRLTGSANIGIPNGPSGSTYSIRIADVRYGEPIIPFDGQGADGPMQDYILSASISPASETIYRPTDTIWPYAFPFEKKYKSFEKIFEPSYNLPKSYKLSVENGGEMYGNSTRYFIPGLQEPKKDISLFSGVISWSEAIHGAVKQVHVMNVEFSGSFALTYLNSKNVPKFKAAEAIFLHADLRKLSLSLSNLTDSYKLYFGVGRKRSDYEPEQIRDYLTPTTLGKMPDFYDGLETNLDWPHPDQEAEYRRPFSWLASGIQIAGWKYGLYSALPSTTGVKFRRDHFGHLRDMLEQRSFSKFRITSDGKNTITESPVSVRFLDGTQAYLTNSLGLDAHDSGIYDKEYASGKPFEDRTIYRTT